MTSITIDSLSKSFGEVQALNHVSLQIQPGEIFFLLGPSGCGKTTLLRHIAGFYNPDAGSIKFGDKDVTNLPPNKRNTGMMFQSYALWPHMTVAKNVAFGLEERRLPTKEIKERVDKVLASTHMGDYAERKINELSGGQQQRVALARALVIRPSCLLLDEPLSNLDAKLRMEMRDEIRNVCREFGLTAVYVTHDQTEALSISDRMAVLDSGRVAQVGSPQEVYRRPKSKLVADFIGKTNFIEGTLKTVDSSAGEAFVETAIGSFQGVFSTPQPEGGAQRTAGTQVTLSIRPECLRLDEAPSATAGDAPNAVAGYMGKSIYLGEVAQHEFHHEGHILKINEPNPKFLDVSATTELVATVEKNDVVILER